MSIVEAGFNIRACGCAAGETEQVACVGAHAMVGVAGLETRLFGSTAREAMELQVKHVNSALASVTQG